MKKNILILACLATVLVACQKDDSMPSESTNVNASNETSNSIDASKKVFVKKILIEEFVGVTYGDAPEFVSILNQACKKNPDKVIKAFHHNNDILETNQTDILVNSMSPNGSIAYPTSLIDRTSNNGFRFIGSSNYQSVMAQQLNKPAECGISISSTIHNNNMVTVEVEESFIASPNSMCNVTVYLVEDKVLLNGTINRQANNFNNNSKSQFYLKGNPLTEYAHENVVRACLTPAMGLAIKQGAILSGGTDHQKFIIEIPANYNINNCSIVAFVSKCINGKAVDVCNAQKSKIGLTGSMN